MAKVQSRTDLTSLKTPEEWQRHGSQAVANIADIVNGKLEFDKNFQSQTVEVTFTKANTDTQVVHTLNKTGVHYLQGRKSVACDIYDGSDAKSTSFFYLRSSVAPATVVLVLY